MTPLKPLVIVAGFPRCGSSLAMQMLDACGIKCAGEFPSFEPTEVTSGSAIQNDWLDEYEAVKVLDPHRVTFPDLTHRDARAIWLDRNPVFQSVSLVKFMVQVMGVPATHIPKDTAGKIVRQMREEIEPALGTLRAKGLPITRLSFERAIECDLGYANSLAAALPGPLARKISWQATRGCLVPRTAGEQTEPGMDIELKLIAREVASV